ncbi:MAG: AAA family ATPase [Anaerolineae bacterium]
MIVPVIGAPGTGKTSLLKAITERYGTPHFELSWMPEFMRMNGVRIDYVQDERIAIQALFAVAREYAHSGHRVVFVSDFRLETLDQVEQAALDFQHTIKLVSSDDAILQTRVLDDTRPSGYRDVKEALEANRKYIAMQSPNSIHIDVAKTPLDEVVRIVAEAVLIPNSAVQSTTP